ncbi:MAG: hypothetical protein ACE5D0_04460 [Fidelibacterota bacterium]
MSSIDIQTIIAIAILAGALLYSFVRFRKNWKQGDADPKCENCHIPEMKKKQKELEN